MKRMMITAGLTAVALGLSGCAGMLPSSTSDRGVHHTLVGATLVADASYS